MQPDLTACPPLWVDPLCQQPRHPATAGTAVSLISDQSRSLVTRSHMYTIHRRAATYSKQTRTVQRNTLQKNSQP